ncbi:Holliday junction resolvase RuvX [Aquifex sp.]
MKVLAVDYGTKRVGLAIGDENLKIVSPKGVIKTEKAIQKIKEISKESKVGKIILGFPLTPSGKEGQRARLVKRFYEELKKELPDVEIILWDERWTTQEALRRLEGLSPKKKKELKDIMAAMIILEEYFDSI